MTKNNNYKIAILLSLMALTLAIPLSTQNAFSHGNVDQESSSFSVTINSGVSSNSLKGQVFIPTVDNLIAIDIGNAGLNVGDMIDIRIHQETNSFNVPGTEFDRIGTVTNVDGITIHLDLDSPVPLIPGQPHILELVVPEGVLGWFADANTYADGNGIFCILDANVCDDIGFDHAFRTYFGSSTTEVEIDIKPNSDPNSINTRSMGVVPVAILGTESFDVTTVDVATLMFGNASPAHDLSDPDTYNEHIQDVNGDGFDDLVSHYKQKEIGIGCGDTEATLTGNLNGGTPIDGTDFVNPKCHP